MVIIDDIEDLGDSSQVHAVARCAADADSIDTVAKLALEAVTTGWHWAICDDEECECRLDRIEA